jgi:hypothetical protein
VAIAETHGACGSDGGRFDDAKKFETKLRFHGGLSEWC